MSKQIDFRWRYQPRKQMDVLLMEYIQENQITTKSQMMLKALRSFWLPYAIAADSDCEKEQVRSMALSCVQALRKQAREILELAELEDASLGSWMQFSTSTGSQSTSSNAYDDTGLSNFL